MTDHRKHDINCGWQLDQYHFDCDCGATQPRRVGFKAYVSTRDDEIVERVARAIFEAYSDFQVVEGEETLPERHFKVAISLYRSMARKAIAAVRQVDDGK